jgi:hypothetical protein
MVEVGDLHLNGFTKMYILINDLLKQAVYLFVFSILRFELTAVERLFENLLFLCLVVLLSTNSPLMTFFMVGTAEKKRASWARGTRAAAASMM